MLWVSRHPQFGDEDWFIVEYIEPPHIFNLLVRKCVHTSGKIKMKTRQKQAAFERA